MKADKTNFAPLVLDMNSLQVVFCLKIYIKSYYSIAIFIYEYLCDGCQNHIGPSSRLSKKEYKNLVVLQYLLTGTFMRSKISHIVKMHYSLRIFFSSLRHRSYSNNNQGRVYKFCKLHDPRTRGSCAGAWSCREHAIFLLLFLPTLGHGSDNLRKYATHLYTTPLSNVISDNMTSRF